MHLSGENIVPSYQRASRNLCSLVSCGLHGRTGEGLIVYRPQWHVVAINLRSVQVDNDTVIAHRFQEQIGENSGVNDVELPAEVVSDVFIVRIRSVTNDGSLATLAVPEDRGTIRPS